MALRSGHGAGRGVPRIEVLPAGEQPVGVPAPAGIPAPAAPDVRRRANGTLADSASASKLGRIGGLTRAARSRELRALQRLGLHETPAALAPYMDAAFEFAQHEVARLASDCGGGICPSNAAALVQAAARAMAGSCAAYAAGDLALGARLGAEIRSHLLGARELCVREATSRPSGESPVERIRRLMTRPKETP